MARSSASTLAALAVLAVLVALDARDLWFKWLWLGSDESYRFTSTAVETLRPQPLTLRDAINATRDDDYIEARVSGWSSFLEPCESMDAFKGAYFLHTRMHNCVVGGNSDTSAHVVPQLYASSGVRADSIAWTACQLLYMHRRPPICHENVVVDFLRRYAMHLKPVPSAWMLTPMSDAEAEALNVLEVISKSAPLSSVVCVEGFESSPTNRTTQSVGADLFGCASPTVFRAAFIGHHATSFAKLHRNKAWLTVHDVNLLGMHYVVRQNAISSFRVVGDGATLVHESQVNLSSSGVLYCLLLCVDLVLLVTHALSAVELAILVARTKLKHGGLSCEGDGWSSTTALFAASLYRSTPIVVLTLVSQLVSWVLVLPTTVILSWSDSAGSHVHALLSLVRVWVLLLLLCRGLWNVFASVREPAAYAVLRWTYVSAWELLSISTVVMLALRGQLSRIREQKYALDKQRLTDGTTFDGALAFSNAYHDEQDYYPLASSRTVFAILYAPLLTMVLASLACTTIVVAARYAYNKRRDATDAQQLPSVGAASSSSNKYMPSPTLPRGPATSAYARLPAEDLLDTAIRAKQLVRSCLPLEDSAAAASTGGSSTGGGRYLRAEQYVEHGVVLEHGQFLRTRRGFFGVVQPKISVDDHAVIGHERLEEPVDAADSPTKRRRMSAHVPSLR